MRCRCKKPVDWSTAGLANTYPHHTLTHNCACYRCFSFCSGRFNFSACLCVLCVLCHCQGIDLLAGVLLFVMPEVDAFTSLLRLCDMFPLHFSASGGGAHVLCSLSDQLLHLCDPELRTHLLKVMPSRALAGSTLESHAVCRIVHIRVCN